MMSDESRKKIDILERRLQREKTARITAEFILETKSREIYLSNQNLTKAISDLEKLTVAVEQSATIVLLTDILGVVEYVNQSFTVLSGYTKKQAVGKDIHSLGLILDNELMEGINYVMQNKALWQGEIKGTSTSKQIYKFKICISPIFDKTQNITNFQFNCEDVTLQKENEARIHNLAHHDTLTQLYNRFSINSILLQAITSAERNNSIVSVLFVDMDRFKQINDTHGHKVGDVLLQQVALRLSGICKRKNDHVARIGGDEFLIVLNDIQDISFVALIANAIVEELSLPYLCESQELKSSPSVGIAVYPNDGRSAEELVKNADTAMYNAKANGRCGYSFFTKQLNRLVEEKNMLEKDLRQALSKDQLKLYYQPQIYLGETLKFGVEALLRWEHAILGAVSPDKFIGIAEERGLIYELGGWVIETAFQQLIAWSSVSEIPIKMVINISAKQIEDKRFVDDLNLLVKQYNITPGMVEFDITETIAMENPQQSIKVLDKIRAMGFELAIDDFGSGYSSLSYLKNLPIQTLKLDRSLTYNLEEDSDNAKICKAAMSLSHDLGLRFVAEGVETKGQAKYLADNGCDVLQGYYFCRPVPATAAFLFILDYHTHSF